MTMRQQQRRRIDSQEETTTTMGTMDFDERSTSPTSSSPSRKNNNRTSGKSNRSPPRSPPPRRREGSPSGGGGDEKGQYFSTTRSSTTAGGGGGDGDGTSTTAPQEVPRISVRGAGSSVYAVLDSGTYQMLHDECSDLCSTILASKSPLRATEAAIDLAVMLSSPKNRSVVWQGDASSSRGGAAAVAAATTASTAESSTALQSILDVLGMATRSLTARRGKTAVAAASATTKTNGTVLDKPIMKQNNRMNRTKSARRKIKEQMVLGGATTTPSSSSTAVAIAGPTITQVAVATLPNMRQALACIIYFLSLDCTMAENRSVASIGIVKAPSMARKIRRTILQHGPALQAAMRLALTDSFDDVVVQDTTSFGTTGPPPNEPNNNSLEARSSHPASSSRSLPRSVDGSIRSSCSSGPKISTSRKKAPTSPASIMSHCTVESSSSSSRLSSSTSSSSKPCDPTVMGRRNRLKRKRLQTMEAISEDGFDFPPDSKMVDSSSSVAAECPASPLPPPTIMKKRSGTAALATTSTVRLSFTSNSGEDDTSTTTTTGSRGSKKTTTITTTGLSTPPRKQQRERSTEPATSLSWSPSQSSMTSSGSSPTRKSTTISTNSHQKLVSLVDGVKVSANCLTECPDHTVRCRRHRQEASSSSSSHHPRSSSDNFWVTSVALESITRIVTGTEEGSVSCLDGIEVDVDEQDEDLVVIDDERYHPVVMTNRLLGKSGIIPLMARAMSQSLAAVITIISTLEEEDEEDPMRNIMCMRCLTFLHHKISILSLLIDGACHADQNNRHLFCDNDPFSFEKQDKGGLIYYLTLVLKRIPVLVLEEDEDDLGGLNLPDQAVEQLRDILHSILRTLTSLTHENKPAAEHMIVRNKEGKNDEDKDDDDGEDNDNSFCGLELLALLVYHLQRDVVNVSSHRRNNESQISPDDRRDLTFFCLNSLANVVETGGARRIIAELKLPSDDESWLRWLCQWLVTITESFQDAVLGSDERSSDDAVMNRTTTTTTTSSSTRNTDRVLQTREEENQINTAGYGCVLLAYLMTESDDENGDDSDAESSDEILEIVIDEMPPNSDGTSSGVTLIRNTLNAFGSLNLHYLGDLGLAIVTPVTRLIKKLDEIPTTRQSPTRRVT